jgi:hypothetical protein
MFDSLLGKKVMVRLACETRKEAQTDHRKWEICKKIRFDAIPQIGSTLYLEGLPAQIVTEVVFNKKTFAQTSVAVLCYGPSPVSLNTSIIACHTYGWEAVRAIK